MRIIKDCTIQEFTVKCPYCKSEFAYTYEDMWDFFGINKIQCPCCKKEDAVFNFEELEDE